MDEIAQKIKEYDAIKQYMTPEEIKECENIIDSLQIGRADLADLNDLENILNRYHGKLTLYYIEEEKKAWQELSDKLSAMIKRNETTIEILNKIFNAKSN